MIANTCQPDRSSQVILLILCFAVYAIGCAPARLPTYAVSGTVEFSSGQPVQFGTVEFYNQKHDRTATGRIQPDGSFEMGTYEKLDGAVSGKHQVVIVQVHMPGEPILSVQPTHGDHVPIRFGNYESSGLEATVEPKSTNRCRLVVERQ